MLLLHSSGLLYKPAHQMRFGSNRGEGISRCARLPDGRCRLRPAEASFYPFHRERSRRKRLFGAYLRRACPFRQAQRNKGARCALILGLELMAGLEPATCSLRVNRTTCCATLASGAKPLIMDMNNNECAYLLAASSTATATATVAPTIGLLPIPIRPIIST